MDVDKRNSYDTGTIGGILAMKYWKDLFSTGYRDGKFTSSQGAP